MNIWPGLTWPAEVTEAAHQADHALRAQVALRRVLRHHRLSHMAMLGGLQNQSHGLHVPVSPLFQDRRLSSHHDAPSCSSSARVLECEGHVRLSC